MSLKCVYKKEGNQEFIDSLVPITFTLKCRYHSFLSRRFKKNYGDVAIGSHRPSLYLLLNDWLNSNQIWCVSYWHVCNNTFLPWPLERSQTVKYLYISITKPISQICIPNFVCLRSIKRYKNTRRDFYLVAMVMPQGWDLGEPGINSVCLLLNHWTKSKRIWCANYSHELGVHKHIFSRRQKVKYHLINYKTNFKDFITKLCLLTNKKIYKIWNAI